MKGKFWRSLLLLGVLVLTLGIAGCGGDDDGGGATATTTGTGGGGEGGTLVFRTASDPVVLDGSLVSDGESLRVIDQIYSRPHLAQARDDRARARHLAESWEISDDGLAYTFSFARA